MLGRTISSYTLRNTWTGADVALFDGRYSDCAVGIATALRNVRSGDRIPVEERFSAPVQTGPGAQPASYTMGAGYVPGVKWPGCGVDHPTISSAEVKERVEL